MNLAERYDIEPFNTDDFILIKKIIRNERWCLIFWGIWLFIIFLGVNSEKYTHRILIMEDKWFAFFSFLVHLFLWLLVYFKSLKKTNYDYRRGIRIKSLTQIRGYKKDRNGIRIKVSNQNLNKGWISVTKVDYKLNYNDWVMICILPKCKFIYKIKVIAEKN
jgi:hypothetical protein